MKIRYIANFLILILMSSLLSCGALSESRRDATTVGQTEAYEPEEESMERSKRAMDRDEPAPSTTTAEKPKPTNRMVIYESSLQNTVNELEPAMQRTKLIVEKFGGYIEKQQVDQQNTVASFTLRVPVAKFADAMDELSQIGKVTSRTINARDITREFSDLSQRLQNRKQLLARLYEILKKTTETKQKIRILNEIARLNKEVESMEARASYLAKKAAFSTIQITFRAEAKTAVNQGSAIGWIRNLRPQSRSLSGRPKFDFAIPDGFLDYREAYADGNSEFVYASPDGVKIRAATIDNNPRA
ncbi:MAG: DUF4349 domain-containing protein, partial [Leptospiraceae bacterium]|nr:DUF4349 domain-containing protein [Leptospiraceae bacterium]